MFEFLKSLNLKDERGTRTPVKKQPEGGLLVRVFKNGDVYPSNELIAAYDLNYRAKEDPDQGNGLDVVLSWKWDPMVKAGVPDTIFLSPVPKKEAKVELFASCRWNEDGTVKTPVSEQGLASDELLEAVTKLGWFGEHTKYVDILVHPEFAFETDDKIYYLPKEIQRGEDKGKPSYTRRENIVLYPVSNALVTQPQVNELVAQ
jgi:hypothetical protein